jgi:hypothetical protein
MRAGAAAKTVQASAKVASDLLRARIRHRHVHVAREIPGSLSELTCAWLTDVLCRDSPGARVLSFRFGAGSRGTHERRALILSYNELGERDPALPGSVFTKTLPTFLTRMLVGFMGHARYEMLFYTRIRPHLSIDTPHCYYSASDRETFAAIHVIEDVAASGRTEFCDESTLIDLGSAESMVDLLADYHGPLLGDARLDQDWRWLLGYDDWFRAGIEKVQLDHNSRRAIAKAAHVIPPRLLDRRNEIWPATLKGLSLHARGAAKRTVLHSDVHIGNWYRRPEGPMGLLDWQCVSQGHWARDLSYALSSALKIEDRRAWDRALIARYVARMNDKWNAGIDPTDAVLRYRQQLFHALAMWTQTLCHPLFQPNSQRDEMTYELIRRITTAIDDHDSLDSFSAPGTVAGYSS